MHRVGRMQRVAVLLRVALGWCPYASCGVPCVVQHAACVPLQVAYVASTLMHCARCTLRRACGPLSSSRSDCESCARAQRWQGGVLFILGGSAMFESVTISDTSAGEVRVAGRGRSGRRRIGAAVCRVVAWWRCMAGQSASRAAASHALRRCAILFAGSCACCISALHGVRCTWHLGWCNVATCAAHGARMFAVACCAVRLHRSVACCAVLLHRSVECCTLQLVQPVFRGQWDSPCCMLHAVLCVLHMLYVPCCTFHDVYCMPVVSCMLNIACCTWHTIRCRLSHAARSMLYVARCTLHVVRCMLHAACCALHVVPCMLHVARCMLYVARCMLYAARRMLCVARWRLYDAFCALRAVRCILCFTCSAHHTLSKVSC
jgi:hypothetical protein